ncbi:MAG: hypothetical protein H6741_27275 [Alphaproteobacteria bacterium]|nr:hypothetical protein [Alphaproteobacteria bacterium]
MSARYTFLPWLRRGFVPDGTAADGGPSLSISMSVNGLPLTAERRMLGPGDVAGLATDAVAAALPAPGSKQALPWRLAQVQLSAPDLPWRYSRGAPVNGRLDPWLALVVVRQRPGVTLDLSGVDRLATLRVQGDAVAEELWDLTEAWAWAHVQLLGDYIDAAGLQDTLDNHPEQLLSRLLCPRRLDPSTPWIAAVVPCTERGRRAGLGLDPNEGGDPGSAPAWTLADPDVTLPCYLSWSFRTGAVGDFEELVRRLSPTELDPSVGQVPLDLAAPGLADLAGLVSAPLNLEGALRRPLPLDAGRDGLDLGGPWEDSAEQGNFQAALHDTLEDIGDPATPKVSPPRYGRVAAGASGVPAPGAGGWLETLNLDPRARVAAGLGAEVIREVQEPLVADAWDQVAEARAEATAQRQQQVADAAVEALRRKHLQPLIERAATAAGPLYGVVSVAGSLKVDSGSGGEASLGDELDRLDMIQGSLSANWRALARPRGALARRVHVPAGPNVQGAKLAPLPGQVGAGIVFLRRDDGDGPYIPPPPPPPPDPEDPVLVLPDISGISQSQVLNGPLTAAEQAGTSSQLLTEWGSSGSGISAGEFRALAASHHGALAEVGGSTPNFMRIVQEDPLTLEDLTQRLAAALRPQPPAPSLKMNLWGEPVVADGVDLRFDTPMATALQDRWPELFLPGFDRVPAESVSLLETNPAFIAAFMAGLNEELSREMLWRGVPANPRGTAMRRFWDTRASGQAEGALDMPGLADWPASDPLGQPFVSSGDGLAVLLLRGELVRQHPDITFYAFACTSSGEPDRNHITRPLFQGKLNDDARFVGFPFSVDEATGDDGGHGHFLVIEENAASPAFGFDAPGAYPDPNPSSPNDVCWDHVVDPAAPQRATATLAPPLSFDNGLVWGQNAAHVADLALGRPMRVILHAAALLS